MTFSKIDINNDGVDEILVVGRETGGLARGPAFQLFDGNGNLLVSQFVLNGDFTNLKAFAIDQNGDGDKEIGIGGVETSGLMRGPAYQIFESNGTLLQTKFVLGVDFSGFPNIVGTYMGPATITLANCTNPFNGTFGFSSSTNISSQTAGAFSGTEVLAGPATVNISLSGTMGTGGEVSGPFNFTTSGLLASSGNGTFAGGAAGGIFSGTLTGKMTTGETCSLSGTLFSMH